MNTTPERPALRRFYKDVTVAPVAGGHTVLLDGRPVQTPKRLPLSVPVAALAAIIRDEWSAQQQVVRPASMPVTAIACTAIDLVRGDRERTVGELSDFAETELLCYRAAEPPELAARQQALWQPLLDWASLSLDAPLQVTSGIAPLEQPEDAVNALRRAVAGLDDFSLAALATAVRTSGSLIIGLALAEGRLSASEAFEAAELDETYNIERWGEDPLAAERRQFLRVDLEAAAAALAALRTAAEGPIRTSGGTDPG